ncbi:lysyl-tRNA synthetase [Rhizophagus clarus]|uniref:lysine--tRNA ligase n=1 Tax=Rhizophagus clarus TaxID=94130 RepID=A0A8H3KWH8_9GLOM|nr:lysyl-tRNA synthetase [Rhizophagus clarus]
MFALRQFRLPLCSIRSLILAQNKNALRLLQVQTRNKSTGSLKKQKEPDLEQSQYFNYRSKIIDELRHTKDPNPYPHKFNVDVTISQFIQKNSHIKAGQVNTEEIVRIAGRIHNQRSYGELIFYDLHGDGTKIQINAQAQYSERDFVKVHEHIRRGDIVGDLKIMKCDIDEDDQGFLEVETPMMNFIASGASAKPFVTRHSHLKRDLYLRIAPELFLKQLVIGGLEKVYEIGRQFRNESIDTKHNPEFTTVEFYLAYADMFDLMKITEDMLGNLVYDLKKEYVIDYNMDDKKMRINFEPPFKRIDIIETLKNKLQVVCSPPKTNARMFDKLIQKFIESECVSPTFITGHPQILSPLAKSHREISGLCERFELIVGTNEIINAYTELNDPFEQRKRFEEQSHQKDLGDEEAQVDDGAFCTSLEYGLPPTAGLGLGIDRLAMILTNSSSIKEVLLFPTLKPM